MNSAASRCSGSAHRRYAFIVDPKRASARGDRKAENIVATCAGAVVTANPGCHMQLRTSLRRNGADIPVRHIVEILDEAYGGPAVGVASEDAPTPGA